MNLPPKNLTINIEPFLGGAAAFFALLPTRARLSDVNADLIDCYRAIGEGWPLVLRNLMRHQNNHCSDYYYKIRSSRPHSLAARAAQFLYLNRTCWNGLYRVNLRGEFNVPIGTKSACIMPSDNFPLTSTLIQRASLAICDFEQNIDKAERNDFVFVDPPYTVRHNNNGFIKYNEKLFSWADEERLRAAIGRATKRGAKVLVTNADHRSIRSLYRDFTIRSVPRQSILSGDASYRSAITELVVQCWT